MQTQSKIYAATVEPRQLQMEPRQLAQLWGMLGAVSSTTAMSSCMLSASTYFSGELYLARFEKFSVRGLKHALDSINRLEKVAIRSTFLTYLSDCSAITILLSAPREHINREYLFGFLLTRSMVSTKYGKASDSLQDLDRALMIADHMNDDFTKRYFRATALLQKGYVLITGLLR